MKKIILSLAVFMTIALSLSAFTVEELTGKWESNPIKEMAPTPEMPMSVTSKYCFTFASDNTMLLETDATITLELGNDPSTNRTIIVDAYMKLNAPGTYTIAGDSITIVTNPETATAKFEEDDLRVRGIEDPDMASSVQAMMYTNLKESIGMLTESLVEPTVLNNVFIAGKSMTCTLDGTIMKLKRKK